MKIHPIYSLNACYNQQESWFVVYCAVDDVNLAFIFVCYCAAVMCEFNKDYLI